MKALLIDPKTKTVKGIELDGVGPDQEPVQIAVQVEQAVDLAFSVLDRETLLYFDRAAGLSHKSSFKIKPMRFPIFGRAVVLGTNAKGLTSTKWTVKQIQDKIEFGP